jgi:hypothetical protein
MEVRGESRDMSAKSTHGRADKAAPRSAPHSADGFRPGGGLSTARLLRHNHRQANGVRARRHDSVMFVASAASAPLCEQSAVKPSRPFRCSIRVAAGTCISRRCVDCCGWGSCCGTDFLMLRLRDRMPTSQSISSASSSPASRIQPVSRTRAADTCRSMYPRPILRIRCRTHLMHAGAYPRGRCDRPRGRNRLSGL